MESGFANIPGPLDIGLSYSGAVIKLISRLSDMSVPFMIVSGVSGNQNAPIMVNRESRRRFLSATPIL